MKLKSKLMLSLIIVTNLSLFVVSYLGYSYVDNILQYSIDTQLKTVTESYNTKFDEWILNKVQMLETTKDLIEKTSDIQSLNKFYFKGYERDPNMYDMYFAYSSNGFLIDGADWIPPAGYDARKRPWYKNALSKGSTTTTMLEDSFTSGKAIVTISTPVRVNGKTVGVLAGDIDLKEINKEVGKINIDGEGYGILLKPNGFVIAHPNEELVNTNVLENDALRPTISEVLKNKNGNILYSLNEEKKLMVYKEMPSTGWILSVSIPLDKAYSALKDLQNRYIMINLVALLITILFSLYLSSRLLKPLNKLSKDIEIVGQGNLNHNIEITSKDEIGAVGHSFNLMIKNLKTLVLSVNNISSNLAASSQQLSASSQELSAMASNVATTIGDISEDCIAQSSTVKSTNETIGEIASSIDDIASSSQEMSTLGEDVIKSVFNGKESINKITHTMDHIEKVMSESIKATDVLDSNSKEIGNIIGLITDIAEQTNLLALNAAIEAARAGEQGRGFAVVAEEVRKLAEESNNAAENISKLITEVQTGTTNAVDLIGKGMSAINEGSHVVKDAQVAFETIDDNVTSISSKITEVTQFSEQINMAAQLVVDSMTDVLDASDKNTDNTQLIASATQEQLGAVEEITASSQNLAAMADDLENEISKFNV